MKQKTIEKLFIFICLFSITLSLIIIAIALINNCKRNVYDVNNDGKVSPADYVLIKNYIMNSEK